MKHPLNVLYLIRAWALGGSHTIIRLFLKHLPKDEFNIVTVPYDAPGPGNRDFIDSVRREGGQVAPERIPWNSRFNYVRALHTIDQIVDKYHIDLIHTHDTQSNVMVGLHRRRWNCAAVGSPYGWWEPRWHLQARSYHWVEKNMALPNFERVYTVSEDMKRKVLRGRTPEERIRVIHTGLDLARFDGGAAREEVRAQLGIPRNALVAGTVSRLFKEKGHAHLIEAARRVMPECPHLWLLVVGTGDEAGALARQAETCGVADRTVFTGFYQDLPGALRAMDIFVQPSVLEEGFPTAVLEAQVMGLPVIASDIGGTHETLVEDKTGLLVPPGDSVALAYALTQLLRDDERRAAMGRAARPWIENAFTLQHMLARIAETYREAYAAYHGQQGEA